MWGEGGGHVEFVSLEINLQFKIFFSQLSSIINVLFTLGPGAKGHT
jgi:hypothetical protein